MNKMIKLICSSFMSFALTVDNLRETYSLNNFPASRVHLLPIRVSLSVLDAITLSERSQKDSPSCQQQREHSRNVAAGGGEVRI